MIKEHTSAIRLECLLGSPLSHYTISMSINGSALGSHLRKENLWTVHLHAVFIAIIIGFPRYSVDYHRYTCRIYHNTYMRIGSSMLSYDNSLTGETRTTTEHHISRLQLYI